MRYDLVRPEYKPSYSPSLFRWMRKTQKESPSLFKDLRVFRTVNADHSPHALFIGVSWDDSLSFCGSRMSGVLCHGGRETRGVHTHLTIGKNLIDVADDFWEEYLRVGRCAIDPRHMTHFASDSPRYEFPDDNTRVCLWCGETFSKRVVERIEADVFWDTLPRK